MTYAEFIQNLNSGARWDVGVSINRSNSLPLDANSVFFSLADAESYVAGTLEGRLANAYPGQLLAVVTENATTIHYIDINAQGVMSLQEVGAKIEAANASIEIVDGKVMIGGFENAAALTLPQKQADGTIAWVPISAIVEGDGNTVTEVSAEDKSINIDSTQTTDDDGRVSSIKYDIKVNISATENNTIELKEDGLFVATPESYDDSVIKSDIESLKGLVGETSVESQIDAKIENYATKTEAQGYADAKDEAIAAAKKSGDDAQADVDALEIRVGSTEASIQTLNGDSTVEGSVDKKITDAINSFATEISEDGTINTFRELVDYVATHGGEAAEMASAIDALETKVGEKSVSVQINEAITAANLDQYATDLELSAAKDKITALEGKVDVEKVSVAIATALQEAKDYADENDSEYDDTSIIQRITALEEVDHSHTNKDILDGITSQNITDWNDAVSKEHEHANKNLLDSYTQTEENLADAVSKKHAHENMDILNGISAEKIAKWDTAEANYISEVDTELKVENEKLSIVSVDSSKISGIKNSEDVEISLIDALNNKVDKVDGMGLSSNDFTDELLIKLNNIEAGAQLNVIEGIKFNGVLLEVGEDKTVDIVHNIAIANSEELGVVKSSNQENGVSVANDGTMSVNSLNVNKLVQTDGEELIINCGAAAR